MRPRWIIDLHEEFPGSAVVAGALDDALIVEPHEVMVGRWPVVEEGRAGVGYGTMLTMTRLRRVPRLGEAVFDDYGGAALLVLLPVRVRPAWANRGPGAVLGGS